MQIHEITLKSQVNEGFLDTARAAASKLAAGVRGAQQGYKQSQINRQSAALADKAFNAWETYKKQIAQYYAGKPVPPNTYKNALLAFIQKNLLGSTSLDSLSTAGDIAQLVDKIAQTPPLKQPAQTPATTAAQTSSVAEAASPAEDKRLFQRLVQAIAIGVPTDDVGPSTATTGATATPSEPVAPTSTATAQSYTVPPGKQVVVLWPLQAGQTVQSKYYKTSDGKWYNELNEPVDQNSYPSLEKLVSDKKGARLVNDPNYVQPQTPQQPTLKKRKKGRR